MLLYMSIVIDRLSILTGSSFSPPSENPGPDSITVVESQITYSFSTLHLTSNSLAKIYMSYHSFELQ